MPSRPKRPCGQAGCAHLVERGERFCPTHRRESYRTQDRHRGNSNDRGYGRRWRALREQVLREEPLCRECASKGITKASAEVDHIVPRAHSGSDDRENLQGLCGPCHSAKTMRESVAGGRGIEIAGG